MTNINTFDVDHHEFRKAINHFSGLPIKGLIFGGLITLITPFNNSLVSVPFVCNFYVGGIPYACYFNLTVINKVVTINNIMSPDVCGPIVFNLVGEQSEFVSKVMADITDFYNYHERHSLTIAEYFSGKYNLVYNNLIYPFVSKNALSKVQDHKNTNITANGEVAPNEPVIGQVLTATSAGAAGIQQWVTPESTDIINKLNEADAQIAQLLKERLMLSQMVGRGQQFTRSATGSQM